MLFLKSVRPFIPETDFLTLQSNGRMIMIGVIAKLPIQEDKTAEFEAIFTELSETVRANEPGCKVYQLCKPKKGGAEYVVMELYEDQAALDAHGKTDYFKAAGAKMAGCFAGAPALEFFDSIG